MDNGYPIDGRTVNKNLHQFPSGGFYASVFEAQSV